MLTETPEASADTQLGLALELHAAHREVHDRLGAPDDGYYPLTGEYFRVGTKGVIGVIGDHVHTFIHPEDRVRGTRDAIKLFRRLLDDGRHVILPVWYLNWASIMSIKRLGGELIGADEDGFLHYHLKELVCRKNSRKPIA